MRYNGIRKDVVSGTGQWLLSHHAFQSWITDFSSTPILAVEGTDITGKSYLTSSVVKYLRTDVITQRPDYRHLVAFFFIDRNKSGHGFDAVAKSLVWQLADKDEPYMKSAARISQRVVALDPDDIIPKLLLENTELEHMDAVFYLVVDGLGDSLDASLLKFLQRVSESRNKKIRVFLTGTPTAFKQIKKAGVVCSCLPISRNNDDDIAKFIEARMNKVDALSDIERPCTLERRKQIREQLSQAAAGDYYKLNSALHVISTLDYMEDIERVIQGTRDDRAKQLRDEIDMLNRERSPRQIQEMNQIIRWVTFSLEPVTEKLMSAALYMVTGEIPLRSLAEQIRTKYPLFEVNSKGCIAFRSSKALDLIPNRSQLTKSNAQNDQAIQAAEIDIVLHFLDNVCPPALYKKLEIREYLQKKLAQKQDQIQQDDKDTGNLRLALDCLRSLVDGHATSLAPLQEYARTDFLRHLSLVDLAMVDRDQKSPAGELLVRLFTKNEITNTLLPPLIKIGGQGFHRKVFPWLENDKLVDEVVRWLRDTAVVSSVTEESDQYWIQSVASGNALEALLKPMVVRMVYRCLREPIALVEVNYIYRFVDDFLRKTSIGLNEDDTRVGSFEQWSQEALQLTEKDTLWHTQMALIYEAHNARKEAIESCKLALQMDPDNWRASLCWGRAVPMSEAVEIMQTAISRQERHLGGMQDPAHMEALSRLNYQLALKYWDAEEFDLAIPFFTASINQAPQLVDKATDLIFKYGRTDRLAALVSLIEQFEVVDGGKHLGDLVMVDKLWLTTSNLLEYIWAAAVEMKRIRIMDTVCQAAIHRAREKNDPDVLFATQYMYGRVVYDESYQSVLHDQRSREDKAIQLWEAALWDNIPSMLRLVPYDEFMESITGYLAPLYLQRALVARENSDSNSVKHYLSKLSNMVPEGIVSSRFDMPPQLWQARYHCVDGDDAKARQIVRTLVQIAIELLSDEDPSNDLDAFDKLRYIFTVLGDDKNALTALAMEARESRVMHDNNIEYDFQRVCNGCGYSWDLPSEMWICKDCITVDLEIGCLTKLKEGKLENICNPKHNFIEVPKWDAEWLNSVPEGMVPWGDRNITLDEWKGEIRKVYIDLDASS